MTQPDTMIPMAILTGYLGAGKTTLLNRILHADHDKKIAVLVNDFGAINIDAKLIVGVEGETITLSNGCICCTIRGDLVEAIANLVQNDTPPDYIIIEASGVSDPAQIVLTFNRSFLRNAVRIDSIIAMVDTEQFNTLHAHKNPQRLLREQVRVSDIVVLNKMDLVSDETRQAAHDWVNTIIDKARVLEATHADIPIETLMGMNTYNPQTAFDTSGPGVHAHHVDTLDDHDHSDHSLVFATWAWESNQAVNLQQIRAVLDELPSSIFRAKGVIYASEIPDTKVVLQLVGKRVALTQGEAWGDTIPKTSIVLIGDVGSVDKAKLSTQFDSTLATDDGNSTLSQFVGGVLEWLRVK